MAHSAVSVLGLLSVDTWVLRLLLLLLVLVLGEFVSVCFANFCLLGL